MYLVWIGVLLSGCGSRASYQGPLLGAWFPRDKTKLGFILNDRGVGRLLSKEDFLSSKYASPFAYAVSGERITFFEIGEEGERLGNYECSYELSDNELTIAGKIPFCESRRFVRYSGK